MGCIQGLMYIRLNHPNQVHPCLNLRQIAPSGGWIYSERQFGITQIQFGIQTWKCLNNNSCSYYICIMLAKKTEKDNLLKTILQLKPNNKPQPNKKETNSLLHDISVRSEKSTKYGSQIEGKSTSTTTQPMDEPRALKILLQQPEILISKKATKLRIEFIPTSNGMRFILMVGVAMINLSWIHTVKQIESGKVLILYYNLSKIDEKKATMQSLVLQSGRIQGNNLLLALQFLHGKYHDDQIQKLYHYLC